MKSFESVGTICLKGQNNFIYKICKITYRLFEDESFEYVFEPNYFLIDLLDSKYFQGNSGLNLDLKKQEYIRKNIIPTFISERVPQKNREDFYELLEKLNMKFMDPIEYLIRTDEQYFGDNLFVIPYESKKKVFINNINGNETNIFIMKQILEAICNGDDIVINNELVCDDNRKIIHVILMILYTRSYELKKENQKRGIEKAKKAGVYRGRKPKEVDREKLMELLRKVESKKMTAKEAAAILNISIDKYYRLKRQINKFGNTSAY